MEKLLNDKNKIHPKCKGWIKNDWGMVDGIEFGCDYEPEFDTCEECIYLYGDKDPETYKTEIENG